MNKISAKFSAGHTGSAWRMDRFGCGMLPECPLSQLAGIAYGRPPHWSVQVLLPSRLLLAVH